MPERIAERATEGPGMAEAASERATPRRGLFAGLKLGGGAGGERGPARDGHPERVAMPRGAFAGLKLRRDGRAAVGSLRPAPDRLGEAMAGYARAFADAARMRVAKLPVLPHQEIALRQAGARLDALDRDKGRDLRSALECAPGLAARAGSGEGRAALTAAVERESRVRQDPGLRAERYAERWGGWRRRVRRSATARARKP